jgi:predicted MFS family arabinose efflux permease
MGIPIGLFKACFMKKNYFVFASSFFFSLAGNMQSFSLIYRLADWYSFNAGQIGIFIALGQFSYFLGCNVYHRFGSSLNPAKAFTAASVTVLLAALPLGFVRIQAVAYASFWVLSLATGFFWPPVMAWLTGGLADKELNREISIFNRSWMGANIAGPLIAGSVYRWNSAAAFVIVSLSYFTVVFLLFLLRRYSRRYGAEAETAVHEQPAAANRAPSAANRAASDRSKPPVLKALDRKLDLFRYKGWLSVFCSALFVGVLINIMPIHIRDGLGYTERSAGMVLFSRCVTGFAGFTLLARFTAWQFTRKWFIFLQCGLIFCTVLMLFAGGRLFMYFIVALFYGLLNSACYNNSIYYSGATGRNPKKNLALHEIFMCMGNATGTAGGGFIYQRFRFTGMTLSLLLAFGLGLAAFIWLDQRRETNG